MLDSKYNLKLIDFGDAKPFDETVYSYQTNHRQTKHIRDTGDVEFERETFQKKKRDSFVGTPLYIAPEMLSDCKSLPASDLWALGVVIYQMHVGRPPFQSAVEA